MSKTNIKRSSRTGKRPYVILGVTGGIAAYKSAYLARLLGERWDVRAVMTPSALEFVSATTFRALTGRAVLTGMFSDAEHDGIAHIDEAAAASLIVVAPATADFISRAAAGRAADLLCAVVLASSCPVLIAPGMNTGMWNNPMTQENVGKLLRTGRFRIIGPEEGKLACNHEGMGKMSEPQDIMLAASAILAGGASLEGKKILVTAGPTIEPIDPVRFISNSSSGKMGYAIAGAASARGASVTLVTGPTGLPVPPSVRSVVEVRTAAEMHKALLPSLQDCDALFMSAAVADWKPASMKKGKIKKEKTGDRLTLELERTPDILADCVKARRGRLPVIFGFCLETNASKLVQAAKAKRRKKGCDYIVANLAKESLGEDAASVTIVDSKGRTVRLSGKPKDEIAHVLLDLAAKRM